MKRIRIYLDTSVISHLQQDDAPEKTRLTTELWEYIVSGQFDIVISNLVLWELKNCSEPKRSFMLSKLRDIEYLEITEDLISRMLSQSYLDEGGLPPRSRDDAVHLALASISDCGIVLSWNFSHIVNLRAMSAVNAVNEEAGYQNIQLMSPEMLLRMLKEDNSDEKI